MGFGVGPGKNKHFLRNVSLGERYLLMGKPIKIKTNVSFFAGRPFNNKETAFRIFSFSQL